MAAEDSGRWGVWFHADCGRVYRLQRSESPGPGEWQTVAGPVSGAGKPVTLLEAVAPTGSQAFYRIEVNEEQ